MTRLVSSNASESRAPSRTLSRTSWRLIRWLGSALLIATGAVHLDLYLTGYQTIPTIGWLFLVQVIGDFVLATAIFLSGRRDITAAGAGLLYGTLLGYELALRMSLFGFREVRTTAGVVAGIVEIVGFALLMACTLRPDTRPPNGPTPTFPAFNRRRTVLLAGRWIAGALTVQAALTFAILLPTTNAGSTNTSGHDVTIKVANVHGVSVLTNAKGYTLYWFAPDSSTTSRCYGTCADYWPPVLGTPSTNGVTGSFSTLQRTGGTAQVTYNGHPLYTYVGDAAPGQNTGNHIRLNGGWWYEMKVSK